MRVLYAVAVGVVSLSGVVLYVMYGYYHPFPNWQEGARQAALDEMRYAMMGHDCAPEMDVWARSMEAPSTYLFHAENNICSKHYEHVGWLVADATVRALFRCDLGDRFAEYSMTVFRDPETISGPLWCEYIIKPKADDQGLGQNFAFVQYSAKYTRNKYEDGEVVFEPAN